MTKDQSVRIVFAEEKKYDLEEETFDNFEDVKDEIEYRTSQRVGDQKTVRFVSLFLIYIYIF